MFQPADFPNRLAVSFNFTDPGQPAGAFQTEPIGRSNYDIYETDYENYAVGMFVPFSRFWTLTHTPSG